SFENLAPGTYTVAMEGQSGFQVTRPDTGAYTVTVQSDHVASGLDFGVTAITSAERGPRFMSVPPSHTAVGQTYHYQAAVSNPDGRPLQFDLPLHPLGLAI